MKWPTKSLGELVTFRSGGTPSKSNPELWDGPIPWFSPKDMKHRSLWDSQDHISTLALTLSALRKVPAGTVAVVVRGMILAHTVPISVLEVDSAINQDIKALIPTADIDTRYLAEMLRAQHDQILSQVSSSAHGTRKIDTRVLAALPIPCPPLPEQRRIAAILDHADALRAKRRESLIHLNELAQVVFDDLFGNPSSNRRGLDKTTIGNLISSAEYGTSEKSKSEGMYPVLRMGNLTTNGQIDLSSLKYMDLPEAKLERFCVRDGDILFNRTNSPDLVGKTAIYRGSERMAYAGYLIRLRTLEGIQPEYISGYLNSRHGKSVLRHMCKSIVGMANINARELKSIEVLRPKTAVQRRYSDFISHLGSQRSVLDFHLGNAETLYDAIQSRAFRGDL